MRIAPIRASELLKERPAHLPHVMVRSKQGAQGYWGRAATVEEAVKNAQWLVYGTKVLVFACTDDAYCEGIRGGFIGDCGTIYAGILLKCGDVKVTEKISED